MCVAHLLLGRAQVEAVAEALVQVGGVARILRRAVGVLPRGRREAAMAPAMEGFLFTMVEDGVRTPRSWGAQAGPCMCPIVPDVQALY